MTAKSKLKSSAHPLVGIIMGSGSDWDTMKFASKTLGELRVPHETRVVSAHRTPDLLFEYAASAEKRGIEVIIAGAGGAAHLPGMTASKTVLPVLGVPVESKTLKGLDSLLSIAQMPSGIPVGTLAIGRSRAVNAALLPPALLRAGPPPASFFSFSPLPPPTPPAAPPPPAPPPNPPTRPPPKNSPAARGVAPKKSKTFPGKPPIFRPGRFPASPPPAALEAAQDRL